MVLEMLCEMCGRESAVLKTVSVEGSVLRVCPDCSKFGNELPHNSRKVQSSSGIPRFVPAKTAGVYDIYKDMGDTELASDYNIRIRKARTDRGLKQEELGKLINERKSVIEQLENGRIRPDDKLIAKLERALRINLKEKIQEDSELKQTGSSGALTLGDLIKKQQKKVK